MLAGRWGMKTPSPLFWVKYGTVPAACQEVAARIMLEEDSTLCRCALEQ